MTSSPSHPTGTHRCCPMLSRSFRANRASHGTKRPPEGQRVRPHHFCQQEAAEMQTLIACTRQGELTSVVRYRWVTTWTRRGHRRTGSTITLWPGYGASLLPSSRWPHVGGGTGAVRSVSSSRIDYVHKLVEFEYSRIALRHLDSTQRILL